MSTTAPTSVQVTQPNLDSDSASNSVVMTENIFHDKIPMDTSCTKIPIVNTHAVPLKTQVVPSVVPLVYFQSPTKLSTFVNNVNVSPLQFATLQSSTVTKSTQSKPLQNSTVSSNQGVILTSVKNVRKPQQLLIHNPKKIQTLPILPPSASSQTYVTMLKPLPKLPESHPEPSLKIINSTCVYQTTNTGQKYVIAPMPKVIKNNRLPVTVTTNSLQSKFALMPMPLTITPPSSNEASAQQGKIFNIQISSDQSDQIGTSTDVVASNSEEVKEGSDGEGGPIPDITCNETMCLDSPEKSEKEYELSITEDMKCEVTPPFSDSFDSGRKYSAIRGVSILKKKLLNDKPQNGTFASATFNQKDPEVEQGTDLTISRPTKPEHRRKSNFSYRKDYDEIEISVDSSTDATNKRKADDTDLTITKVPRTVDCDSLSDRKNLDEIKVVKDEPDINMNDGADLRKILQWENGIGTLPGSDLKFVINEFNIVEYITPEEYNKITSNRLDKIKDRAKNECHQEELQCTECGCFGLPSEFISSKYCCTDCQVTGDSKEAKAKELKLKRKRKKGAKKFEGDLSGVDKEKSVSEEDDTSNENSQDRYSSRWSCSKKGFSWTKYLDDIKGRAAPVKLFKDAFPYNRNGFRPGMKLEGIDPLHPSYFCVLSVSLVCGYRVRLHFDGYPDNYDFWVNADSMDIFPIGWCEKYGHVLQPPSGYTVDDFNWVQYLKTTRCTAAPKHLFANRAGNAICPNGFRVGMKLEAVDKKNTALVCVATIRDMMDNRILVHFDSWDDIYDYWADPTSPYIHPVGWCDQNGHKLTPPNDYPEPETFSWTKYLKETKSVPAPVRAFKQRPACGFKRGMRLECVDRRCPQLIRVASVDDSRDHHIRIAFDGWPDRYAYWVDDDNDDIHPVGWCHKTGHPLETPLTPDGIYDYLDCPTIGCKGIGHIQGPKYATHTDQKDCPYADENINAEKILPDRLLSPDRLVEAVVPVSIVPKEKVKPRLGRPPKYLKAEVIKQETEENPPKKTKLFCESIKSESDHLDDIKEKAEALIEESKVDVTIKETWAKHSNFLRTYTEDADSPLHWSEDKVTEFVASVPGCEKAAEQFRSLEIDGDAFLLLSQRDLLDFFHIRLGPAVKLYNIIILLRKQVNSLYWLN